MVYNFVLAIHFAGEFFVDILLPMSLRYNSAVHCNSLAVLQPHVEEPVRQYITHMKHCDIARLNVSCSPLDASSDGGFLYESQITVNFNVLVRNAHENAVSPDCDPLCKRKNMRGILAAAHGVKTRMEEVVVALPQELAVHDLPHTHLLAPSLAVSRPQMLCDQGRVFTHNRLCGQSCFNARCLYSGQD